MKTRILFIIAASVIALSSTAMADDHLLQALSKGLDPNGVGADMGNHGVGQGSPFFGNDTQVPASATIEDLKPGIIRQCDPATHTCEHQVP